jgi:hypothetical protein
MILRTEMTLLRKGGEHNIITNLHECITRPCLLCVWKCVGEEFILIFFCCFVTELVLVIMSRMLTENKRTVTDYDPNTVATQ